MNPQNTPGAAGARTSAGSTESRQPFKPGDVLHYRPRGNEYHCRQAQAVVQDDGRAFDTFWRPTGDEGHCLWADELAGAEVMFNRGDFDALDYGHEPSAKAKWETYAPVDRGRIGYQHQCRSVYLIRKGATPDLATQIENAEAALEEAHEMLRSAEHRVEWRGRELADLRAKAAGEASK